MKRCRTVEPLLYLYRGGELTPAERTTVADHVAECSRCRNILRELTAANGVLELSRTMPLAEDDVPHLADDIVEYISIASRQPEHEAGWVDIVVGRLRPALGFVVLAAAGLLAVQQSRDAIRITNLEDRLHIQSSIASASQQLQASRAATILDSAAEMEHRGLPMFSAVHRADFGGGDATEIVRAAVSGLFRKNRGLFDDLSSRYPHLATVTLENGIDARERKILDTEGKQFLEDFKRLVQEGER